MDSPGTFDVPYLSLTDAVANHAAWYPGRTALVCGGRRLTWPELNGRVNRVANALLAAGLRKGDAVAVLMGNCVEMLEVLLGTVKAGGVTVPLSPMATGEALARMVEDSGARTLIASRPYEALLGPVLDRLPGVAPSARILVGDDGSGWVAYDAWLAGATDREPGVRLFLDDTFNIIYSSGTTGVPKGIVHTHYARQQFALMVGLECRFDPTAVGVLTTPLYANGTWIMLLGPDDTTVVLGDYLDRGAEMSPRRSRHRTTTMRAAARISAVPGPSGAELRLLVPLGALTR